ncbi:hypothetical protein RFI_25842, partial [Reticulomyxa filosa]
SKQKSLKALAVREEQLKHDKAALENELQKESDEKKILYTSNASTYSNQGKLMMSPSSNGRKVSLRFLFEDDSHNNGEVQVSSKHMTNNNMMTQLSKSKVSDNCGGGSGNGSNGTDKDAFEWAVIDMSCYNENPRHVFNMLRSVAKKLLKDDDRERLMDFSAFSVVSSPENALIKRGKKKKKKRGLNQFFKYFQFNNINTFVQIQTLQEKNMKDCDRAVKCIIKIGKHFRLNHNFNPLVHCFQFNSNYYYYCHLIFFLIIHSFLFIYLKLHACQIFPKMIRKTSLIAFIIKELLLLLSKRVRCGFLDNLKPRHEYFVTISAVLIRLVIKCSSEAITKDEKTKYVESIVTQFVPSSQSYFRRDSPCFVAQGLSLYRNTEILILQQESKEFYSIAFCDNFEKFHFKPKCFVDYFILIFLVKLEKIREGKNFTVRKNHTFLIELLNTHKNTFINECVGLDLLIRFLEIINEMMNIKPKFDKFEINKFHISPKEIFVLKYLDTLDADLLKFQNITPKRIFLLGYFDQSEIINDWDYTKHPDINKTRMIELITKYVSADTRSF